MEIIIDTTIEEEIEEIEAYRGNRGNRGNRGKRENHWHGNYHNDNDYFNQALNNNNNKKYEKNDYQRKKYNHSNNYNNNINNIDDYFNVKNNKNEINENKEEKEDEYNNNNIFKSFQRNRNLNNKRDEGVNDSSKQVKEVKNKAFISYNQLKDILSKDDNEIIQFFTKYRDLCDVFENTRFTSDMIYLMIKLLSKISKINSGLAPVIWNQILTNTKFLIKIREKLKEENFKDSRYLETFYDVAVLCNKLIDKFTDDNIRIKHSELSVYADVLQELINQGKMENNLEMALKIIDVLNDFREKEKHKKLIMLKEKQKKLKKKN